MLHLIRVPLATDVLARWAAERGWVGRVHDEGRALHHLVTETLGPGAFRCFRLLVPPRRAEGNLYAYSPMDGDALRAAAEMHALPEHLSVLRPDRLMSKPMPAEWRPGQRLGFDLRVWPVRRLRRPLALKDAEKPAPAGSEIDAFLLEALRDHPDDGDGMKRGDRTRQAVYLDWLAERLAPVAALDLSASRVSRFLRGRAVRDGRTVEGPDATIHGTLTVDDPAGFPALLARGVGRHRAYGYGMMLLRPPHRPAPGR